MPGMYEELKELLGEREGGAALSTFDLMKLPSFVRFIIQQMLRHPQGMTYSELREKVEAKYKEKGLTQAELDEGLEALVRLGLLVKDEESTTYKVNLGKTSSGTRARSEAAPQVWGAVEADQADEQSGQEKDAG